MQEERVDIKTPEFVSLQFDLAGLGSRAAALIIDQLILYIVTLLLLIPSLFVIGADVFIDSLWPVAILFIVLFVINYGYFFIAEYFYAGRTVGKRLMGIRVIQENGHSITLLSSFIRNLIRLIDALPTGYFIGIMMIFLHPQHKRLGDLAAGTIVVHERHGKKGRLSPTEKEIKSRGLTKDSPLLEGVDLNAFGEKEWKLIKAYALRFPQLTSSKRFEMTRKLATAFSPKFAGRLEVQATRQVEDILFVLYLKLREEWEYEL
ncbi:RDD family protein [Lentibacillus saliphilus]|uniref:RDD family protein n=1 Tax=Lentibacillus saliphilus TaxID=2737028 RepID=UPI001C302FDE|nr:RDD family protein [Lentibacillus saliphilus]